MIRGRFMNSTEDCAQIFALRRSVFVEEQGFGECFVRDDGDAMAVYALVFDEADAPSGTGRLIIDDDRFMLGRVCVLKDARGQGLGDLVMRMLLLRAQELGAPSVFVSAQLPAVGFYARYGFRPIGEAHEEGGAPRQLMRAMADEISIEGNCHKGGKSKCAGDCERCQKS